MQPRDTETHDVYGPWLGLVWITIHNASHGMVRLVEVGPDDEYEFDVTDSSGKAVPLTERGKQERDLAKHPDPHRPYTGSISVYDLGPTEEITSKFDFAALHQIKPGQAYKVKIRRTRGLPTVDENGKPLKQFEVSCTVEIPEHGILR
jgi:hypothetical protein